MLRVVIDNCAVDPLIDRPGAYEAVRGAIDAGNLEILYTHVTIEEASRHPDPVRRRQKLQALTTLGKPVPTGAFVLGISELGQARLTGDAGAASVEVLRSKNAAKHSVDALVAATAGVEGCALLTEDRRLRNRATDEGIKVLNCQELFAELGLEI
jgi:hypothetical protein